MRHSSIGHALPRFKPIDHDVEEYRLELETLARYLLLAPEEAGVEASVLLETVQAMTTFHGEPTLRLWLHRTAATEARHLRAFSKPGPVDSYLDSVVMDRVDRRPLDPADLARELEHRMEVLDVLSGLPDNYRCALLLKDGEGLAVEEVAGLMGTTTASVRSVLYRARHVMRVR